METKNESLKLFKTKVAGVARRQSYLKRIFNQIDKGGDYPEIYLEREPENKHDSNAIKVIWKYYNEKTDNEKEYHIGYIAAHVASSLAKDIDRGIYVHASFDEILGGYDDMNYGMLITILIDRKDNEPSG